MYEISRVAYNKSKLSSSFLKQSKDCYVVGWACHTRQLTQVDKRVCPNGKAKAFFFPRHRRQIEKANLKLFNSSKELCLKQERERNERESTKFATLYHEYA